MSRSVYDACGPCRNGQHSRCYAPCDCADGGHAMVGDREPVAPSPPVSTISRMKDAVAFLAFMRGLVPDSTVSLTLGDSGLTVTISNRATGRWYGYILDADDLEKPSAGLADELVRIHENRSHGDDKHPILPHADLERMKETAREGWETARLLAVTYCARASEKKATEELVKLGRGATPYGTPHDRLPGLEQANTEAHRAIAKLKAKLDRVTAHRDALSRPCPNGRLSKANQDAVDLALVIESLLEHGLCSFDDFSKRCPGSSRSMFETNVAMLTVADVTVVQHPHGEPLWGLTDEACDTARWEGCLPLARRILAERAQAAR